MKKINVINKLDSLNNKFFKKLNDNSMRENEYYAGKPLLKHDLKTAKDEWYHEATKKFKQGDLVTATSNHPGWGDYQERLLGGIVLDTNGEAPSLGTWSQPFYKVLWPYGLIEDIPGDWISIC